MKTELHTYEKQPDGSMKLIKTQQIEYEAAPLSKLDKVIASLVKKGVLTVAEVEVIERNTD